MNKAPDFSLPDQNGDIHHLKDYFGKWLVIYFYPKDETPGCTTEACNFRDGRSEIAALGGVELVGVSKDSVSSHKKFADKHNLNFTILSDETHSTIDAYGAWRPRKFMGREYTGTHRDTVIVTPHGEIAREFRDVDAKGHYTEVVDALRELMAK